jgi:hypothetical protein
MRDGGVLDAPLLARLGSRDGADEAAGSGVPSVPSVCLEESPNSSLLPTAADVAVPKTFCALTLVPRRARPTPPTRQRFDIIRHQPAAPQELFRTGRDRSEQVAAVIGMCKHLYVRARKSRAPKPTRSQRFAICASPRGRAIPWVDTKW